MSLGSASSSGNEDGDAEWRAAIDSVASTAAFSSSLTTKPTSNSSPHDEDQLDKPKSRNIKYYQLKARQLLNDMLEKTIEVVSGTNESPNEDSMIYEGGIQLFKDAPHGIVFDHIDEFQRPNKKPRILPGKEIDENSKKFKREVQSVAIEGTHIIAAAEEAVQKSLANLEARESAAKAAAKIEEERVAALKKIRGERWLPCMAKERQAKLSQ